MDRQLQAFGGGVAVITGAGSGIGEGLARRAATLGMKVVLADISLARIEAVAAEIRRRERETGARRVPVGVDRPQKGEIRESQAATLSKECELCPVCFVSLR